MCAGFSDYGGTGPGIGGNIAALIANYAGETVTIFTSSGGQSGAGFTGVVLAVNNNFVRLITRIGPPPGCALGNSCSNFGYDDEYANKGYGGGTGYRPGGMGSYSGPGGFGGYPVYSVGSVTDIPVNAIVSFVHNAV